MRLVLIGRMACLALLLAISGTSARAQDDLAALDRALMTPGVSADAAASPRAPVRLWAQASNARQTRRYQAYLEKADGMTQDLMRFRERMVRSQGEISLQQLGAFCHSLSLSRDDLRDRLGPGEERFRSYRLMNEAVERLEDAWRTWRAMYRFRPVERSATLDVVADDETLKIKLQRARQAIEDLRAVTDARNTLTRELNGDF